jgi:hypothetical protein
MDSHGNKVEYFFNTQTGQVEHGRQSSWEHLMGPFDTPAEAARALDTATERSDAWDEADKAWRGED